MAETFGFIIGEYSIPTDMPIIYITDSNNARTLQRNIKQGEQYTHRYMIRHIKQGIDHAIANHLEYLTSLWPQEENLDPYILELYKKGEDICRIWVSKQMSSNTILPQANYEAELEHDDNSTQHTDDSLGTAIDKPPAKNRYHFNTFMYHCLGHVTIVKVFSHQLNTDFSIRNAGNEPAPNLFAVSANQISDNAVTHAHHFYTQAQTPFEEIVFYPPFSPTWCFSFQGKLINKGATKLLQAKIDEELLLRIQHRPKQGLFARLSTFNSLNSNQIGDDTIYRKLIKMHALCWTHSVYLDSQLAQRIWSRWRALEQNEANICHIPSRIPKKLEKLTHDLQ